MIPLYCSNNIMAEELPTVPDVQPFEEVVNALIAEHTVTINGEDFVTTIDAYKILLELSEVKKQEVIDILAEWSKEAWERKEELHSMGVFGSNLSRLISRIKAL